MPWWAGSYRRSFATPSVSLFATSSSAFDASKIGRASNGPTAPSMLVASLTRRLYGRRLVLATAWLGSLLLDRRAGLGLGLPLIAALAAEVSFRGAESGGTEVTMVLEIPTDQTQ